MLGNPRPTPSENWAWLFLATEIYSLEAVQVQHLLMYSQVVCIYVRAVLMTQISLQTRYSLEYTYIWCLVELLMKLSYVGTSKSVWELYLSQQPIWLHVEASSTKRSNKRDRIIKNFPLCLCFCGYWKKSLEWSCLNPFSRKLRYFNKGNIVQQYKICMLCEILVLETLIISILHIFHFLNIY